jgi:type I restriction enzyme S subunit
MSLPRYSKYKDSGAAGVGAVPQHWEVKPVKAVASINDDALPETTDPEFELAYVDIGSVSLDMGIEKTEAFTFKDAPSRARRLVRNGDVIVSTVRTYLKAIAAIAEPPKNLVVSTGFAVVRPLDSIAPGFAKYALQSPAFVDEVISRSTGVSYPAINASDLGRIVLPIPPLDEQSAIATLLDQETAKIDALVAEQEKLLALLAEKRQATISHAVIRGLNPDAPMKDSGVAALGAAPAHWKVQQLRYIAKIVRGASPRPAGDPQFFCQTDDDGSNIPWVTVAEVTKDAAAYLDAVSEFLTPLGAQSSQSFECGTVIFTNSGATLGVPKILAIDCCANDGILAFKNLAPSVEPLFLYFFLLTTTERLRTEMKQGGGQPNLNTDIVKNISFVMPPMEEQSAIVEFLKAEFEKLDSLKAEVERTLVLLKERRAALITAAVTGKIDVRNVVPLGVAA